VKRSDLDRAVAALREPLRGFVRESRVRVALVVNGSGQVLAQHGFGRGFEVANVAALAAAAFASARALAGIAGAGRWTHLHHAGQRRELALVPLRTPLEELVLVAIFEDDSSLGLVQLFADRLAEQVGALEAFTQRTGFTSAESFERELDAGLNQLFPPEP
jgi:predicted regulator of Ras-like GTPase activity (Roadblock/LC7/MglB family)